MRIIIIIIFILIIEYSYDILESIANDYGGEGGVIKPAFHPARNLQKDQQLCIKITTISFQASNNLPKFDFRLQFINRTTKEYV